MAGLDDPRVMALLDLDVESVLGPQEIERLARAPEGLLEQLIETYEGRIIAGRVVAVPAGFEQIDERIRAAHEGGGHIYSGLLTSEGIINEVIGLAARYGEDSRIYHHRSCVDGPVGMLFDCIYARIVDEEGAKRVYHFPTHRCVLERNFTPEGLLADVAGALAYVVGDGIFCGRNDNYRSV